MARSLPRLAGCLCVAGLFFACNKREAKTVNAADLPKTGSLAVEARLLDLPAPFPANDLYNYVFIMKYRVLKVLRGQYDDSIILVGHYNPRFARPDIHDDMDSLVDGPLTSFQPGDVHLLVLSNLDSLGVTPAIEDNYPRDPHTRYFARWVAKE